jgi:aerobic-type carbon monoxide dehydrogenase small subunit (CoxS/CutS family)
MKKLVKLNVNGWEQEIAVATHHTLLDVLRREFKLFSVREGCGIGMCGACTVLLDGKPVSTCLMLAALAEGHAITTVESLGEQELHPIQQAFVDNAAFQCSYCTPGFILTTKAFLEENPSPAPDEVKEYLAGNLCRCGSYVKILDAVLDAAERMKEQPSART